jgi:hypothetical protein
MTVSEIGRQWNAACTTILERLPSVIRVQYTMDGHIFDLKKEKLSCFTSGGAIQQ